jgi:hypothetical protein
LVVEVEVGKADLRSEIRETVQKTPPPPEPKKKKDVSAEDLEWIKSFRPKGVDAGARPGGEGEILEALAAGAGGPEGREPWKPSPEQVVLEWPRLEERIVEGAD